MRFGWTTMRAARRVDRRVVLLVLALVVAAVGCGRSTSLPDADRATAPTTAAVPADPADSPVFDLPREGDPEEFEDAQVVTTIDPKVDQIRAAVAAVEAEVGPDPELGEVSATSSGVEVQVRKRPGSKQVDRYVYDGASGQLSRYPSIPNNNGFFRLSTVDLDAPGRLVPAMQQRRPGFEVREVTLLNDEDFGLHWYFTGSDQLHFLQFVASPQGELWAGVS